MWAYHELEPMVFQGEETVATCRRCGLQFKTKPGIERAQNETCYPLVEPDYRELRHVDGTTQEILVGYKTVSR